MYQGACKPGSVFPAGIAPESFWQDRTGMGSHSSWRRVAACALATNPGDTGFWPGSKTNPQVAPRPACMPPLFGLAPGGVCHAAAVAGARGALLPHPFTLAAPNRSSKVSGLLSVALSLTRDPGFWPKVSRRRALPATLVSWSPDFPRQKQASDAAAQPPGATHLACPRSRSNSSSNSNAPISPSTTPSIRLGRQRR